MKEDIMAEKKLPRVAVIGSGYWGKNLARNYHDLGALGLICDSNETVLAAFREKYPDVETCLAVSDVLGRDDIRGVVIATPAETHYALAREALLAGKHVYVEKPLVLDEDHGRDLIHLATAHGLTLMVGHLLQYHPVFVLLKKMASSGELGRINYIYSHRLNLGKIRREENILWSFAPHDISMILSLAGETPEQVTATGGNYLHMKIADVTITHLDFPSGLKAHIFVSWLHPFKEQKLVVVGEKKMAVFDDTLPWPDKLLLYPHKIRWEHNIPVPDKAEPERVDVAQAEPLRQECVHFLDCVANGCAPLTDGREGLAVLRVLNRAQSCLDSCGRWEARGGKREAQSAWREEEGGKWEAQSAKRQEEGSSQWTVDSEERAKRKALSRKREEESRKREESLALGAESGAFVHETAVIDPGVQIGANTKIWHFSHVLQNSRVGENCNIGKYVEIGPDVIIGNGCKIQNNVSVFKGITLEDFVFCGPGVVFTNIFNPRAAIRKMDQIRPTLVRSHATLGANCTIVCGVSIGEYAFIGAGAVVTRDVPDHALMVGNPARQTGYVCACGEKLTEDFLCVYCQTRYEVVEKGLRDSGM